ncbi:MAG: site-specific DNA-methyltransferase [Desulfobacter sp.]|nr:MAG: site-specific DNA-methyltransferase [Desulfobacter sp.]
MKTEHKTIFSDSKQMSALLDQSADLVVTSPPYPMIKMWDAGFVRQDPGIQRLIDKGKGYQAFELMHQVLDWTWKEAYRVLKPGGFACINIGDATRTLDGNFALYTNHARILKSVQEIGFTPLPCILWRKQTNAPNKFMGSGMLPAGAYVTLEHEYILILRKGGKRVFASEKDKEKRRASALFWEERNLWFSDIWFDIKGSRQALADKETRKRSAAFPLELAYRLINMYSVKEDLVVDPFLGLGTTALAAMAAGRNSVGYEIDNTLGNPLGRGDEGLDQAFLDRAGQMVEKRLNAHDAFVADRVITKGPLKYDNCHYGVPVMTNQERFLLLNLPQKIDTIDEHTIQVRYLDGSHPIK